MSAKMVQDTAQQLMEFFGQETALDKDDNDDDDDTNYVNDYRLKDDDIHSIVHDPEEFRRLKSALQAKGAVTNEMLRQRLHVYVHKNRQRWTSSTSTSGGGTNGEKEEEDTNLNAHNDNI